MSTFPTPWTVKHHRWGPTGTDAHGNAIEGHADPVNVAVYGWAAPNPAETPEGRVTIDMKVYAPAITVDTRDEMTVNGVRYTVEGPAEDFNHGPFGFAPGVVINLRRVEG